MQISESLGFNNCPPKKGSIIVYYNSDGGINPDPPNIPSHPKKASLFNLLY
jgi:hypothetical protein